jgi:hypothetical protein
MNIPGFTAEASLYRTRAYFMAGSFEQARGVIPQQSGLSGLRARQRDRPVGHIWSIEPCSPCRLLGLWPPLGRQLVRNCSNTIYESGLTSLDYCQLQCYERPCSPLEAVPRPPIPIARFHWAHQYSPGNTAVSVAYSNDPSAF